MPEASPSSARMALPISSRHPRRLSRRLGVPEVIDEFDQIGRRRQVDPIVDRVKPGESAVSRVRPVGLGLRAVLDVRPELRLEGHKRGDELLVAWHLDDAQPRADERHHVSPLGTGNFHRVLHLRLDVAGHRLAFAPAAGVRPLRLDDAPFARDPGIEAGEHPGPTAVGQQPALAARLPARLLRV